MLKNLEQYYARHLEPWPPSIPKEMEVKALIDTGASVSIIDSKIVDQMNLSSKGFCLISGFDSSEDNLGEAKEYPNYEVGLSLLDESRNGSIITIKTGQVVGHTIYGTRFDAIIGMDVLKHCKLNLDGPNNCFEVSAPEPFVEEISSVTLRGA